MKIHSITRAYIIYKTKVSVVNVNFDTTIYIMSSVKPSDKMVHIYDFRALT